MLMFALRLFDIRIGNRIRSSGSLCDDMQSPGSDAGVFALLNDVELDLRDPAFNHPKLAGGRTREIDDASGNVRTAVIDPDSHGLSGRDVRHPQLCAERQGRMSGGHRVRIEFLAADRKSV